MKKEPIVNVFIDPEEEVKEEVYLCIHYLKNTMKCKSPSCKFLHRTKAGYCDQKGVTNENANMGKKDFKNYIHRWNI